MNCDILCGLVDNINDDGVSSTSRNSWARVLSINCQDVLAAA